MRLLDHLRRSPRSREGTILIVVLLAMALIGAVVVEFAYGIYVSSSAVHNWSELQRASVYAESGLSYAVAYVNDMLKTLAVRNRGGAIHTYPGQFSYSLNEPFEGESGDIAYTIVDETGKLNVNMLDTNEPIQQNHVYQAFGQLCEDLDLPQSIRDIIHDWIDSDQIPMVRDGEIGAKNRKIWSIEELYEIPLLERKWIDALLPYVTIFGSGNININAADPQVLKALYFQNPAQADAGVEKIIEERDKRLGIPPNDLSSILSGANLSHLTGRLVVKGSHFKVTSTGRIGEIRRTIETVVDVDAGFRIAFWREY